MAHEDLFITAHLDRGDWDILKTRMAAMECYAASLEDGNQELLHKIAVLEGIIKEFEELRNARDQ